MPIAAIAWSAQSSHAHRSQRKVSAVSAHVIGVSGRSAQSARSHRSHRLLIAVSALSSGTLFELKFIIRWLFWNIKSGANEITRFWIHLHCNATQCVLECQMLNVAIVNKRCTACTVLILCSTLQLNYNCRGTCKYIMDGNAWSIYVYKWQIAARSVTTNDYSYTIANHQSAHVRMEIECAAHVYYRSTALISSFTVLAVPLAFSRVLFTL